MNDHVFILLVLFSFAILFLRNQDYFENIGVVIGMLILDIEFKSASPIVFVLVFPCAKYIVCIIILYLRSTIVGSTLHTHIEFILCMLYDISTT